MTEHLTPDHVFTIRSTVDAQGRAACDIQWGEVTALLTPEAVLATAQDLMAAASAAETDVALIQAFRHDLELSDDALGFMLRAVRRRRVRGATTTPALRIAAVAGVNTGQPLVHITRGSQKGELTPDEARGLAMAWTEAATAAVVDARLRYALGEWDRLSPAEIEKLFTLIQQVQR